jgi:uncharacterized membrane protein (DUF4010 family)
VVAVTGLGWLGYLAVRILGPGRGLPIAGLAGGFVSGAATTAAMARHGTTPGLRRSALAGALMASVATLVQLVLVTAIADVRVAKLLAPAAIAGSLVLAAEALWLARRRSKPPPETQAAEGDTAEGEAASRMGRPFALTPAVVLVAGYAVLMAAPVAAVAVTASITLAVAPRA